MAGVAAGRASWSNSLLSRAVFRDIYSHESKIRLLVDPRLHFGPCVKLELYMFRRGKL
jgi:hypothetical protein